MTRHRMTASPARSPRAALAGAAVAAVVLLSLTGTAAAIADTSGDDTMLLECTPVDRSPSPPAVPTPAPVTQQPVKPAPGKPPLNPPPTEPSAEPPAQSTASTAAAAFGWGAPIPQGSDDFTGTGLDRAKWAVYNGRGHDGNGRRTPDRVAVTDGKLVLTGNANGDSAGMASTFDQRYGRWEARVRTVSQNPGAGRQYHPLLIVWPESNRWPDHGEYDFFENSAPGLNRVEAFLHYPNHQPKRQEHARLDGVDTSRWQNIAFEWTPQHLKGYVNGVEWFSFSGNNVTGMPSGHLTIQLDNFHGAGMTPARYEIDWVNTYAIN